MCIMQVRHGNEDTFREMLRIKRSVTASFDTTMNLAVATRGLAGAGGAAVGGSGDAMAALETTAAGQAKVAMTSAFVKSGGTSAAAPASSQNKVRPKLSFCSFSWRSDGVAHAFALWWSCRMRSIWTTTTTMRTRRRARTDPKQPWRFVAPVAHLCSLSLSPL